MKLYSFAVFILFATSQISYAQLIEQNDKCAVEVKTSLGEKIKEGAKISGMVSLTGTVLSALALSILHNNDELDLRQESELYTREENLKDKFDKETDLMFPKRQEYLGQIEAKINEYKNQINKLKKNHYKIPADNKLEELSLLEKKLNRLNSIKLEVTLIPHSLTMEEIQKQAFLSPENKQELKSFIDDKQNTRIEYRERVNWTEKARKKVGIVGACTLAYTIISSAFDDEIASFFESIFTDVDNTERSEKLNYVSATEESTKAVQIKNK